MECKNCHMRTVPFFICMRTGKSRQIIEKESELTGCNIDGALPPTLFKGDENE